ncbi:MAG: hypothetical protein R3346_00565 [Candidatus Spechtbacterales bacterium]|nr:hypothetical protein [Candidatus Spechtbacterales bacterium]
MYNSIIEISSIVRLFIQLNLVVAGAASLWCMVFSYKGIKDKDRGEYWNRLALYLGYVFIGALVLFILSWWAGSMFIFSPDSLAHEGVVHSAAYPDQLAINGFSANMIWVSILSLFNIFALILYQRKNKSFGYFKKRAFPFFALNFFILSVILSLSAFTGGLDKLQVALTLHNWHSIITLGTVICVDILFMLTIKKDNLKRILYPFYPIMSAAIWFGLGLDFVSSFLIIDGGLSLTDQFIFNQAVVIILILNGALLSVGINDELIALIKPDRVDRMDPVVDSVVRVSGSISIVSWITVTVIDFFIIPIALPWLVVVYLALIFMAYIVKPFAEEQFERLAPA